MDYSLTQKIGGLSTILLSFLLVVILYSVYKLDQIEMEMRDVAEIDIPLTELMNDIELLQLEQHLWMEKIREKDATPIPEENNEMAVMDRFNTYSRNLAIHLDRAVHIIQTRLASGRIRLKLEKHRSVIQSVSRQHEHWLKFENQVKKCPLTPWQITPGNGVSWKIELAGRINT